MFAIGMEIIIISIIIAIIGSNSAGFDAHTASLCYE